MRGDPRERAGIASKHAPRALHDDNPRFRGQRGKLAFDHESDVHSAREAHLGQERLARLAELRAARMPSFEVLERGDDGREIDVREEQRRFRLERDRFVARREAAAQHDRAEAVRADPLLDQARAGGEKRRGSLLPPLAG